MSKSKQVDVDVWSVLNLIHLTQTLHVLPLPGGILDQDALFITIYNHVEECQGKRSELDRKQEEMKNKQAARAPRR